MKKTIKKLVTIFLISLAFLAAETTKNIEQGSNTMTTTNPQVKMETSKGTMIIELYADKAPITVENFLAYVAEGYYDGLIFHRVIPNFMIQGGGFAPGLQQKETKGQIKNEAHNGLKNERGTLAMARTMVVDSATSQFFINSKDNAFLDYRSNNPQEYGYCVFGKVIEGTEVIDTISAVATGRVGPYSDVPAEDVVIIKIEKI